ncbi:hypothetical protein ABPG75_005735 [Micractinium tetrahymenae]
MAHCWGWPKALATGAGPLDAEAVALFAAGDYVIAVYTASLQVWAGGQHRLKLGELHRNQEQLEEEGPNLRAHWCPQKRVLAVATGANHLQLYALNVSSEPLWRLPGGGEVRRVNLYLSHSLHLDYGPVRIADLGGDAKSLLVALSNGTMQVFSWQGKLRGQANPFIAAYEGSRSRRGASRLSSGSLGPRASLSADGGAANGLGPHPSALLPGGEAAAAGAAGAASTAAAAAGSGAAPSVAASADGEPPSSALMAALTALDLPQPTPAQPAEVAVSRIHYCPAARMLAVVLADGRCALCRTSEAGIHPVEQLQLFRWAYKPAGPAAPAAVAAALNPTAQLLALGLSHGRVAIYTLQSLLSSRHQHQHLRSSSSGSSLRLPERADSTQPPASTAGPGQPEPARVLSLADWGYRSSVVGPAEVLQWSPDGRVLAVGYGERGMAVWTPSGCRLVCSLRQAVATAVPGASGPGLAGATSPRRGEPAPAAGRQQQQQQATAGMPAAGEQQARRGSTESASGGMAGSPRKPLASSAPGGLWSQTSSLNPSQAPEPGVLEGGVSAMAWTVHGYQLLVAEQGRAAALHQLEFARQVHGAHRVAQPWAAAGGASGGPSGAAEELHALQAADRILLITEARQTANPALRLPAAAAAASREQSEAEAAGARPDLVLQHVKLPQQYIDAAYPLLHAAISQDRADVAVAGTRGLAVYSRRARRWRLFGDATQERSLRVQGLLWLPGGVIAAVAYVDGKDGAAAPQLLLYPQYHLDNASLLARLPLQQVPVAMDSAGWNLVLAFHPLEIKLFRVTVEGPLGPAGRPLARLAVVRELSIMGMGNPLQEIALIDPATLSHPDSSGAGSSQSSLAQQAQQAEEQQAAVSAAAGAASDPSWPQLTVATKPAAPAAGAAEVPLQCVLLRAGGIMSKLDLSEGSEVLLSDAIERFWLPLSSASATAGTGGLASRTNSFTAAGGVGPGAEGGMQPSLSTSSSMAALGRQSSEAELPAALAAASAAAARMEQQRQAAAAAGELGPAEEQVARLPPWVEMPWWTYGARGMQLWFPSSLSEPLTPSRSLSIASLTATGLAAAAAAAATNSTDPELEFDREVYPVGVSLAEVSIVGVMQRTVRSQAFPPEAAQSLCFHPLPESQPVLPCLLRRLLQKGRQDDALELARWHSSGPHFNRSLEWLLFTALEIDAEQQPSSASSAAADRPRFNSSYSVTVNSMQQQGAAGGAGHGGIMSPRSVGVLSAAALAQRRVGPLLVAAARLISQFPQFPEIVVSVARKTDAALWPALFAAVGSPGRLCQGLMQSDKLQSAACCLVIVEQIEGSGPAQELALQLMQAALSGGQYGLAADLLRFLLPPGEAGEALLESPGKPAATQAAPAAAAAEGEAAEADASQQVQQEVQQQQSQQQQAGGSWFWGLFGGGGGDPQATSPASGELQAGAAAPASAEPAALAPLQAAAAGSSSQESAGLAEDSAAAGEAWRLTGQHAWKMLDAGALREAAQLARSLSGLHGGLSAQLAATASEAPAAQAQLVPSAAAIASGLFVAANEFAAEQEGDAALSADLLLAVFTEAGCVNLAAALALLLGDQPFLQRFAGKHPEVWADLHTLLANDVHLCGYAPVLSPLPSPVVGAGGLPVGALLAA